MIEFVKNSINAIYRKIKYRKIIFYITDKNILIAYYKRNILVDTYASSSASLKDDEALLKYIEKRNRANAKFIVQSSQEIAEKIALPSLSAFSNMNPILNYCLTHFNKDIIYSYKVLNIGKDNSEIWRGNVTYMPLTERLNQCFEILYNNRIPFFGVYFNKVISDQIASEIAQENKINIKNYIYAFVSLVDPEEVSITIFHEGSILHSILAINPVDQTDEYISGHIDQILQDSWLKFKSYITHLNLSKLSIFLVNDNLKRLILANKKNDELYIFPAETGDSSPFHTYLNYFIKDDKPIPASNSEIASYKNFRKINSMLFPPLYTCLGLAILLILYINMMAYYHDNLTSSLYKKYTEITKDIRAESKSYPEITNINQLADLYYIESNLENNEYPFKILGTLLDSFKSNINLERVSWLNRDQLLSSNIIELDVSVDRNLADQQFAFINEILTNLKKEGIKLSFNISRVELDNNNITADQLIGLRINLTNLY
ncbi:MAG: hypothetical protein SFT68_01120 [Rickettsiaceae bacterium]|nr:hypothetical protein [Rickettsiaceae bacterium]